MAPALGEGPNGSAGLVEYIPLFTVSPDGKVDYHAKDYLYGDQERGPFGELVKQGMNAFFWHYGLDPETIDWEAPW